jgi:hypothetical protein
MRENKKPGWKAGRNTIKENVSMEISQHDGTVPGEQDNRDNNTRRTNSYPKYRYKID